MNSAQLVRHCKVMLLHIILCSCALLEYAVAEKPNIVVIIADDMGWNDVGFHGSEIPTPNIDALAYSGIILNRHYALPSCTPSRTAFLTGKYPSRIGMQGGPLCPTSRLGIDLEEKLMPQYFKDLGYSTHLVGKWHVGFSSPAYLPTNRGFDNFFGYLNGCLDYYDGTHYSGNLTGIDAWRNTTKAWKEFYGKYLPTLLAEEAVEIIHRHAAMGNKNGLFMTVASPVPHRGNRDFKLEPPPTGHGNRTSNISDVNRRILADVVKALDDTVGDITVALRKKGMINNTIIAFFSDNGAPTSIQDYYQNYGSNWPLKGEKMSVHEGGVRTAAAIWASSFTNSSKVYGGLFHISDWLPTLYTAAGGNLSDLISIDGINQWNTLETGENIHIREELLVDIEDLTNVEAVIKGKWKLVRNYKPAHRNAFSDNYSGLNFGESVEYNKTEIYFSQVATSLIGEGFNDSTIERLRNDASITQICDPHKQLESMSNDCHTKYCLYNIEEDPCECNDLAANNKHIVEELASILDHHRQQLVKEKVPHCEKQGHPGESNYWEPWIFSASSCNMMSKLVLLIVYLVKYL